MKARWIISIALAALVLGAAVSPSYALDANAFAQGLQKEKQSQGQQQSKPN